MKKSKRWRKYPKMSLWNSILSGAAHFCTPGVPQLPATRSVAWFFFFFSFCIFFLILLVHLVWVSSLEALNGTWSNVFVAVVLFRFPLLSLSLSPSRSVSRSSLSFCMRQLCRCLEFHFFLAIRHIKFVFAVLQTLIIMSNLFCLDFYFYLCLFSFFFILPPCTFSALIKCDKTAANIVVACMHNRLLERVDSCSPEWTMIVFDLGSGFHLDHLIGFCCGTFELQIIATITITIAW